jgi:NADH-quinone oxidoreductase subunit F
MRLRSPEALTQHRDALLATRDPKKPAISICAGTGCVAYGALSLADVFRDEVAKRGLADKIDVRINGCHGFCERGPLVLLHPQGWFLQRVQPADVAEIIDQAVLGGKPVERLQYVDPVTGAKALKQEDVPFYKHQMRVLLEHSGWIDPTSIDDYIANGGYQALQTVLTKMKPEQVVEAILKSGLRGRGGGGFPAGTKWKECRGAPSADGVRYVIANGDEGDPGAFMDRSLMEGNPHLVLEGMLIGAFAIGSPGRPEGYIYVRHEYPLAVERLGLALEQARQLGLLGEDILGTGLSFDIRINKGGGAFVCGESTALIASIEGQVGEPRAKHIHTVVRGLNDRPTNLNNVETWANVPLIISRGVDWFTSIGTGDVSKSPWGGSKGTKIFALVGKVNNTGLVEVPMGKTLREIIFDIGGGIRDGKKFKAVQTGGPSGGCLPEKFLDLPVDFDKLTEVGSMMGSGGMIVMDDATCMVDFAKYFTTFLREESCGKCTTCREGLRQLAFTLERIGAGKGEEGDLPALRELGECVMEASLCALGGTAANPLLSTLSYFPEEYAEHVKDKVCRALSCKELVTYTVVEDMCTGCQVCERQCPTKAIVGGKDAMHRIEQDKCIKCGVCFEACKFDSIRVASGPYARTAGGKKGKTVKEKLAAKGSA